MSVAIKNRTTLLSNKLSQGGSPGFDSLRHSPVDDVGVVGAGDITIEAPQDLAVLRLPALDDIAGVARPATERGAPLGVAGPCLHRPVADGGAACTCVRWAPATVADRVRRRCERGRARVHLALGVWVVVQR